MQVRVCVSILDYFSQPSVYEAYLYQPKRVAIYFIKLICYTLKVLYLTLVIHIKHGSIEASTVK